MFGSSSPAPTSSSARLISLVQTVSTVLGFAACWAVVGPQTLYVTGPVSLVGLLVIHLARLASTIALRYEWGLLAGVVATAWTGIVVSCGVAGVLWVCLLAATTAPALRLWAHCRSRSTTPRNGTTTTGRRLVPLSRETREMSIANLVAAVRRADVGLPDLDLDALCLSWRRSYLQLLDAGSTPAEEVVVEYRQHLLDEIGHRDARGLDRWLASSPRAAGNPLPYLQRPTRSPSLPDSRERHESDGTP